MAYCGDLFEVLGHDGDKLIAKEPDVDWAVHLHPAQVVPVPRRPTTRRRRWISLAIALVLAAELKSFKIALGTEVRLLSKAALESFHTFDKLLAQQHAMGREVVRGQLTAYSQLPPPAVYTANTDKIGALGAEAATATVFFYGQLALVAGSGARSPLMGEKSMEPVLRSQVGGLMVGLLKAAQAAEKLLKPLKLRAWREHDAEFKQKVTRVAARYGELFPAPEDSAAYP